MTLKDRVEEALIKAGKNGKTRLAAEAGLSTETIRRVVEGHSPTPKTAYALAKACGCTDEEAFSLAKGRPSSKVRRPSGAKKAS
jgi:transcriptional regulator with XRE-family HTH domain